jgi:hypothetical protein
MTSDQLLDDSSQDSPPVREPVAAVVTPPSAPTRKISDDAWARASGTWVDQHLRSTPVSQSSESWNHLMSVIPRLRDLLEAEL